MVLSKTIEIWVIHDFMKGSKPIHYQLSKSFGGDELVAISTARIVDSQAFFAIKEMDNVLVLNRIATLLEGLEDGELNYLEKHYAISRKPSLQILKIIESYWDRGRPVLDENYYRRTMIDDLESLSELCLKIDKDYDTNDSDFMTYMTERFLDRYEDYIPEENYQEMVIHLKKVFYLYGELRISTSRMGALGIKIRKLAEEL